MSTEDLVADLVRAWVRAEVDGDADLADRAVWRAQVAHRAGASIGESCREAEAFTRSWLRHPSHRPEDRDELVALAS